MAIKRSADGTQPPYLTNTNQRKKAAATPYPSAWSAGMASQSACKDWMPKGPTYNTANFKRHSGDNC